MQSNNNKIRKRDKICQAAKAFAKQCPRIYRKVKIAVNPSNILLVLLGLFLIRFISPKAVLVLLMTVAAVGLSA